MQVITSSIIEIIVLKHFYCPNRFQPSFTFNRKDMIVILLCFSDFWRLFLALKDVDFLLPVVGVYVLEAVGSWRERVGLLTACWLFQQSGRKYNLFLKRRLRVKQ